MAKMAKHEPARPVIGRSPHRSVGVITIPWFQPDPVEWESQLERGCIYSLVALWVVVKILHQPFKIPIPSDKGERYYIPDFAVTLIDGTEIVIEVKPAKFVPEKEARLKSAQLWLEQRGIHFVVLTEVQLRHRAWVHIVPTFLRYARWDIDAAQKTQVMRHIGDAGGEAPLGDLWDGKDPATKIPAYFLIGRRELFLDPREWEDDATRVSLIDPLKFTLNNKGNQNDDTTNQSATDLFRQWFGIESWGTHASLQTPD